MKNKIAVNTEFTLMNKYIETEKTPAEQQNQTPLSCQIRNMKIIHEQRERLLKCISTQLVESYPSMVFFINKNNQILHCNSSMLATLGLKSQEEVLGLLPGELLSCVNSETLEGCGNTDGCTYCGLFNSIIGSCKGENSDGECTMLTRSDHGVKAVNYSVRTVELHFENETFSVVYMKNISAQKYKEIMEQMFFHDLLNAVNGIIGATSLIINEPDTDVKELAEMALDRAFFMGREIKAQRLLMAAEDSTLTLEIVNVNTEALLKDISTIFSGSSFAENKKIVLKPDVAHTMIKTDKRILLRILENLVKNALEASMAGQEIILGSEESEKTVLFSVQNSAFIPENIQPRLFRRSFSTKGQGRGLGTYSVKMFTENYLRGRVGLNSSPQKGTTFFIEIPKELH